MSWNTKKIGKLLKPSGHDRAGSNYYPVLSVTMHEGLVDQSSKFKKRIASRDTASYRVVYSNELVVGFPIDEGVLGFQTKYPAGIVSPAYGIWKLALPEETHIPYLEGYLRSGVAREIYASKMRGGVARRRTISKEEFLDIDIPFPPLDEQKRIAAVLGKADSLRRQRQESLQLTEKLLQSVCIDLFGDPDELPQMKLGDLLTKPLRNGLSPASGGTHRDTVFTLSAITRGYFNSEARKEALFAAAPRHSARVSSTDFLICRGNGNLKLCGRGQFPTDDAIGVVFPDTIIAASIDVNRIAKAYFETMWNSQYVRMQIEGGARTANGIHKVNQATLEEIRIPVPDFDGQVAFGRVVESIGSSVKDFEISAKHMENFFLGLQQRAFRGELDLSRLVLDQSDDVPTATVPAKTVAKRRKPKAASYFLQAPADVEPALKKLDRIVKRGELIPWSADYFTYRILGTLSLPFGFSDAIQKAEQIFDRFSQNESRLYDRIRDVLFDLLGQDGKPALLRQRFEQIEVSEKDSNGREIISFEGRKEIIFEPVS